METHKGLIKFLRENNLVELSNLFQQIDELRIGRWYGNKINGETSMLACQKPPVRDWWHEILSLTFSGFGHYKIPLIYGGFRTHPNSMQCLAIRKPLMKHKWNFDV